MGKPIAIRRAHCQIWAAFENFPTKNLYNMYFIISILLIDDLWVNSFPLKLDISQIDKVVKLFKY